MPKFHNPYNFIWSPEPAGQPGGLAQGAPLPHDRWSAEAYSGRITFRLKAATPLLIPDVLMADSNGNVEDCAENGHKTFRSRRDRSGKPLLPVTTLKGALRAAYEVVTNSRMGVFEGHTSRLAYRMATQEGLRMVPARVAGSGHARELHLYFGSHTNGSWPTIAGAPGGLQYAAWLPMWGRWPGKGHQNGQDDRHGKHGWFRLQQTSRTRNGRNFKFWEVIDQATDQSGLSAVPGTTYPSGRRYLHNSVATYAIVNVPPIDVEGHYCITNQNIGGKHDERVFFCCTGTTPYVATWQPGWDAAWKELILDYRSHEMAKKHLEAKSGKEAKYEGNGIGNTALSRHLYEPSTATLKGDAELLTEGTLCYALCKCSGEIEGLFPVQISRRLHEYPPERFLSDSLKPATDYATLSPADRVFGWASQEEDPQGIAIRQHRGQMRIRSTKYVPAIRDPFTVFDPPLPLAILGQPKPQQARFYLGQSGGTAQNQGDSKEKAGYDNPQTKSLRGRKVYPHQSNTVDPAYFKKDGAAKDATDPTPIPVVAGTSHYREYVRRPREAGHSDNKDSQNRSIHDWVNVGVAFDVEIEVVNLNKAELGALLWLLRLGPDHYLKLGGGRPLAFGSVILSDADVHVFTGAAKSVQLRTLDDSRPTDASCDFAAAFKDDIAARYGQPFEEVPFIKQFRASSKGFDGLPVHYPRKQTKPSSDDKNYEWFVDNENAGKRSLPDIDTSESLLYPSPPHPPRR